MSLHEHEISEEHDSLQAMVPAKKNQIMWIVSITVGIIVIILGGLLITGNLLKMVNPGAYTASAIENTIKACEEEKQELENNLPVLKMQKEYIKKPYQEYTGVIINDIPNGAAIDVPGNFSFFSNVKADVQNKRMENNIEMLYNSGTLMTASIYAKDNELAISLPELTGEGYYGTDTTKWVESYATSAVKEYWGELNLTAESNFNIFEEMQKANDSDLTEASVNELKKLTSQLIVASDFSNSGTEVVKVNGRSIECAKITAVVPNIVFLQYVDDCYAVIKSDEKFIDSMKIKQKFTNPSAAEDELWNEYDENVNAIKETFKTDVNANFYIYNKMVVKVNGNTVLNDAAGKEVPMNFDVQIGTEEKVTDAFYSKFVFTDAEKGNVKFVLESMGNHTGAGNKFSDETSFEVTTAEENILVSSFMDYDSTLSENNFVMNMGISTSDETKDIEIISLSGEGTVLADAAAGTMSAELDDFELCLMNKVVDMELEWEYSPLEGEFDDVQVNDVLAMSKDELDELNETIIGNLMVITPYVINVFYPEI